MGNKRLVGVSKAESSCWTMWSGLMDCELSKTVAAIVLLKAGGRLKMYKKRFCFGLLMARTRLPDTFMYLVSRLKSIDK